MESTNTPASREKSNNFITNVLHLAANNCIPLGKVRSFLKSYCKENKLNGYHFKMRSDRRNTCSLSFINYKNSKREFQRQKRRAEYQENRISDLDVVTSSEVAGVIKLLKTDKSHGPDMVINEHLKYAGQSLHIYLAHLFNGIL